MQGKKTAIAGAAMVLAGCGGSSQTAATVTSTVETTKTVTVTAPSPASVPKTVMETGGTYRVGTDIVPDTYRSAARPWH
jgi:PBP1b-binding outer membrane lipoprotein LpoB